MMSLRIAYSSPITTFRLPQTLKAGIRELALKDKDVARSPNRDAIRFMLLVLCFFLGQLTVYILGKQDSFDTDDTFEFGTLDLVAISAIICISYVMIVMKAHNLKIGSLRISGQHWRDWTVASILAQVGHLTMITTYMIGSIFFRCHFYFCENGL
jgi:hypothetical protein